MPPPVFSKPVKPVKPLYELSGQVFEDAIKAVKRNFPKLQDIDLEHPALKNYALSTQIIKDAWPLPPRAALHALGFSLKDIPEILGYEVHDGGGKDSKSSKKGKCKGDSGSGDKGAKRKEDAGRKSKQDTARSQKAVHTRSLVAQLARETKGDFPAALSCVWRARAWLWWWKRGLAGQPRRCVKNGGKKKGQKKKGKGTRTEDEEENDHEDKQDNEEVEVEEGEHEAQEKEEGAPRVKRRLKPKLLTRNCSVVDIKIAVILARRPAEEREGDQLYKAGIYRSVTIIMNEFNEEVESRRRKGAHASAGVFSDTPGAEQKPTAENDVVPEEGGEEEEAKQRKDSKAQAEGSSSTDAANATAPEPKAPQADKDTGATMSAIMAAAQELGDPSLTEDGPSCLTFDITSFTDHLLAAHGLSRRDPPLDLGSRSKRFLPTAAQDIMQVPDSHREHFYFARSDAQRFLELSANYARMQALWLEYRDGHVAAGKTHLDKKAWALRERVSLEEAFFGDVVGGSLAPEVCWDNAGDVMERVGETWQSVWEIHLRTAWGDYTTARADEVFERTDRA